MKRPAPVVARLRELGHDVAWVAEDQQGATDSAILEHAQRQQRLVVTLDKDFGELAFRARLPARCGVVLFRLTGTNPDADNHRVVSALQSRPEWAGLFSIVEDDRIRSRPLPSA